MLDSMWDPTLTASQKLVVACLRDHYQLCACARVQIDEIAVTTGLGVSVVAADLGRLAERGVIRLSEMWWDNSATICSTDGTKDFFYAP